MRKITIPGAVNPRTMVFLLLFAAWAVVVALIDPRGEFPLNDDWLYARVVEQFSHTHILIQPQLAAVSLVFQTLWGSGFAAIFGLSFTVLRLSNLVLHLAAVLAVGALALELGAAVSAALLLGLTVLVSPVALASAFSFMPESALLATVSLALLSAVQWERGRTRAAGLGFLVFGIFGYLVHPMALILPLWFLVRWWKKERRRRGLMWPAILTVLSSIPFLVWYMRPEGASGMTGFWLSRSWGMDAPLRLFTRLPATLITMGLFLLPVGLALVRRRALALPALLFVWSWGQAIWCGGTLPLPLPSLENVIHRAGIGYVGLQGTPPFLNPWFWRAISMLSMVSLLGLLGRLFEHSRSRMLLAVGLAKLPWAGRLVLGGSLLRASVTGLVGLAAWILFMWPRLRLSFGAGLVLVWLGVLLLAPPSYDRYLIPVLPLVLLVVLAHMGPPRMIAWIGAGVLTVSAVIGVHDYLAWNRTRWDVLQELTERHEIAEQHIDGGYEWAGWHFAWKGVPEHEPSAISRALPWWIRLWAPQIDPCFVISLSPLPGYTVLTTQRCATWLPGWRIYLLERSP